MGCTLSPSEILEDFKSFYFDTALSTSEGTLDLMDAFVGLDGEKVLFGTDFPAVGSDMVGWYTRALEEYFDKDGEEGEEGLEKVMVGNARKLFPRFFGNE